MQGFVTQSVLRFCRGFCRQPRAGRASGAANWYPPWLSQYVPPNPAVLDLADKLLLRLPRFVYEDVKENTGIMYPKNQIKLERAEGVNTSEMRKQTNDVYDTKIRAADDVWPANDVRHALIIQGSSHRDGAMFKKNWGYWGQGCPINLADRTETVSELQKFSVELPCYPDKENCISHLSTEMIQIFSLRLAKTPIKSSSIQLYGYLAARDFKDGLLNYVFNRSRDDPLVVDKGSFIEMNGPRRAILMFSNVLMEFDMRIKTGEKEEDDLELIDGLVNLSERDSRGPFTLRFNGNCGGAVDMCSTIIQYGMEAIIEVVISEIQSAFDLTISSIVSLIKEDKEVQLFHGAVGQICTKRFVLAVESDTLMHLKFQVGKKGTENDIMHFCTFDVNQHGCVNRQIKLEAASISVRVTVASYDFNVDIPLSGG